MIDKIFEQLDQISATMKHYVHKNDAISFSSASFFSPTLVKHFNRELAHIDKSQIESYLKISNHLDDISHELTYALEQINLIYPEIFQKDSHGKYVVDDDKLHKNLKHHPRLEEAIRKTVSTFKSH